MFAKNKIVGITNGKINMQPGTAVATTVSKPQSITAASIFDTLGTVESPATMHSINYFTASNYQYYLTGIVPNTPDQYESPMMSLFYRDIYKFDAVGGCAVDIESSFPFSDWELRGLEDNYLKIFNDALDRLGIHGMLAEISTSFMVDGFYAGSLIFDSKAKQFMDVLSYDALQCSVKPSAFNNIEPEITITTNNAYRDLFNSQSKFIQKYLNQMPRQFLDTLQEDQFTLDPITTLFIGRRRLINRAYTSYLERLLPTYLIEKTLFRGTLTEALRRQRSMTHITVGTDSWVPTPAEIMATVQQFQMAENDPNGAWVATRDGVQTNDIRAAGDFWKWTDTADQLMSMKLRALGISEAFLSGDASYSSSESAYSTFIETVAAYRDHLTNKLFYQKLFPLIAVVNGLYAEGAENKCDDPIKFLYNMNDRENLLIPTIHWHKELEAKEEESQFDTLQQLSELGVPIAIKTWITAAGLDFEDLVRDLKEDDSTRKLLQQYTQDAEDTSDVNEYDDSQYDTDGEDEDYQQQQDQQQDYDPNRRDSAQVESAFEGVKPDKDGTISLAQYEKMLKAHIKPTAIPAKLRTRQSILSRFKGRTPDEMSWTGTDGKKHWSFNQERDRKNQNWQLAKIAAKFHSDVEYRKRIAEDNRRKGIKLLMGESEQ